MGLSHEHVEPQVLANIKLYILTRAELLFPLCYEIPCRILNIRKVLIGLNIKFFKFFWQPNTDLTHPHFILARLPNQLSFKWVEVCFSACQQAKKQRESQFCYFVTYGLLHFNVTLLVISSWSVQLSVFVQKEQTLFLFYLDFLNVQKKTTDQLLICNQYITDPPRPIFGRQVLQSSGHITNVPLLLPLCFILQNPGKT